jgi:hypothetical protein
MINLFINNNVGPNLEIIWSTSFSPICPVSSTETFSDKEEVYWVRRVLILRGFSSYSFHFSRTAHALWEWEAK